MKVAEVKLGMMLEPIHADSFLFKGLSYSGNFSFVSVRRKTRWTKSECDPTKPKFMMYLGTRKDVNVKNDPYSWSNRYALFDNEIVAIDPPSWKYLKPV